MHYPWSKTVTIRFRWMGQQRRVKVSSDTYLADLRTHIAYLMVGDGYWDWPKNNMPMDIRVKGHKLINLTRRLPENAHVSLKHFGTKRQRITLFRK